MNRRVGWGNQARSKLGIGREVYHVEEWEDKAMQALIRAALKRELAPHRLPACPA